MYELLFKIICLELGKIRVTHNPVPGVENINSENNKSNQLTPNKNFPSESNLLPASSNNLFLVP